MLQKNMFKLAAILEYMVDQTSGLAKYYEIVQYRDTKAESISSRALLWGLLAC